MPLMRSLKILTLMLIKFSFFLYLFFCGKRTGIFHDFFLLLTFQVLEVSHLTWRARHSQPLFATRICFLFCNQLARAFEGLVIRRAVEIQM
jgi:hypothetical protein